MARRPAVLIVLLLTLARLSFLVAQDCDHKCRSNSCDSDGVCICDLPSNSTMLSGDRLFYGGEFCDIPRTMCDGTNNFWCQNGTCNEIIQGESYNCICQDGYAGKHCELEGIPCGDMYCYNNAECIQADVPCDCPEDWMGSDDCSKPTVKSTVDVTPPVRPASGADQNEKNSTTWYLPVMAAAAVTVMLVTVLFIGFRSMRKRASATNDFRKLQMTQLQDFVDEDEEAFARAPLSKAQLA